MILWRFTWNGYPDPGERVFVWYGKWHVYPSNGYKAWALSVGLVKYWTEENGPE
jgi:hypothetical protein